MDSFFSGYTPQTHELAAGRITADELYVPGWKSKDPFEQENQLLICSSIDWGSGEGHLWHPAMETNECGPFGTRRYDNLKHDPIVTFPDI